MHIHKSLEEKTEECKALLRSTNRQDIEKLIDYISQMGYFIAPGSKDHHRFKGGLVSHSLETYRKALEIREEQIAKGVDPTKMPKASVIIASLMHDLCKADALRFNEQKRCVYTIKKTHGHSSRSVRKVRESGFVLTPQEADAILWHMGGKKLTHGNYMQKKQQRIDHLDKNPLSYLVFHADKRSIGEAKERHHRHDKK